MLKKMGAILAVLLMFFPLSPVFASGGFFGNIAEYLQRIYGWDANAGLTTFPILNIPMGGRAEGMAGAFAAVADDVSFIEFNPAGSSMLERTEFAVFHNNWIADTNIESIAYTTRFGNLGIGAGLRWLYTPFTEYNMYAERVSGGFYSEGVAILNASYNFFSGYYFSGLSVGVNLKGAFRLMPDYFGSNEYLVSGMSQSAVMGMVDIGVLTRFDLFKTFAARERNASAALVIRNLGPPSMGEPLPTAINAAISFKPIRPVTLAIDFTLPVNLTDFNLSERPYAAFGVSTTVTNFLSMRAGFLLRAGNSRLTVGSAIYLDRIAIDINYTLDMLTQMQPLNRVSVGVRLDMGDRGRRQLADRVEELYILGHEAYSRGNIPYARICWEEALRLDPRFDPARDSLIMLEEREALIQRVDDLYRLY